MFQTNVTQTNNLTFGAIRADFLHNNFIVNSLVHANIYISLAAVFIAYLSNIVLDKSQDFFLCIASFSVMFLIYTANRFSDIVEDEINAPNRVNFIKRHGKIFLYGSLVLFIGSIIYGLFVQPMTALFMAFPILIGALYSFAGLKKFFLVKNLTVGLGWASLPMINASYYQTYSVSIICFAIFVGVTWLINSIIFDVKDIAGDKANGVITLPVRWGLKKTKLFCVMLNVCLLGFLATLLILNVLPAIFAILFLLNAHIFSYILLAKPTNNPLFYGLFVDGEFIAVTMVFGLVINFVN